MLSSNRRPDKIRFSKMHGAGNDVIILDLRDGATPIPTPEFCRYLANRNKGVGADMVLGIRPPRGPSSIASFEIWTAQGDTSRQCGNGARCVAAWLVREGLTSQHIFYIDSPSGTHTVKMLADGQYQISMGAPSFNPADIPLFGFGQPQALYPLSLGGKILQCGAVSMGNPHAVIETHGKSYDVSALGKEIQNSSYFAKDVNVGFVNVKSRHRITLTVYEFGAGETQACGSGACAAVALLAQAGRVDKSVVVELPGGELEVVWAEDLSAIYLSGPTEFVFDGELANAPI